MKALPDGTWGFTPTERLLLSKIGKLTKERAELLKRLSQIDEELSAHSMVFASMALERDHCPRCGGVLIVSTDGTASCLQCGREVTAAIPAEARSV